MTSANPTTTPVIYVRGKSGDEPEVFESYEGDIDENGLATGPGMVIYKSGGPGMVKYIYYRGNFWHGMFHGWGKYSGRTNAGHQW